MTSELEKFNTVLRKILSVPREELLRRDDEWKKNREQKGRKRGRKPANDISTKKND
ncbi:MAG: hypothetical protein WAN35_20635 [Terracidiphilus sp.]